MATGARESPAPRGTSDTATPTAAVAASGIAASRRVTPSRTPGTAVVRRAASRGTSDTATPTAAVAASGIAASRRVTPSRTPGTAVVRRAACPRFSRAAAPHTCPSLQRPPLQRTPLQRPPLQRARGVVRDRPTGSGTTRRAALPVGVRPWSRGGKRSRRWRRCRGPGCRSLRHASRPHALPPGPVP
jgi:hypothetical protein